MIVPGIQFLCGIILYYICHIPYINLEYEMLMSELPELLSFPMMIYLFFIGPIAEEIIFRGVILCVIKNTYGILGASVVQALLFGIYHMNFYQACYAIILGLILAYVMQKTGNLVYSMFLHVMFNIWGNYEEIILKKIYNEALNEIAIIFVMMIFLVIGIKVIERESKERNSVNAK